MINGILIYLLIGCFLDWCYGQVEDWLEERNAAYTPLEFWGRIMVIALWPVGLAYFLYGFIKVYFNDNDDTNGYT
tara:strand:- start:458 stop:682 length:225 start_codon:yes stop_codon:yes gene_type:complete